MNDALLLETRGTRASRFAFPVPDALVALVFALAALIDFLPAPVLATLPRAMVQGREDLVFVLIVEGGFLMMQGTLVDIATRLKKRPPVWAIFLIVGGVLLFGGGHAWDVLKLAWERGMVVFIPLLVSVIERGYLLWYMPVRTRIQKIAARALISNRIITGLGLLAAFVVMLIVSMSTEGSGGEAGMWPVLAAGALYFGIAAYDDFRVRQKKFAESPRVLFRYDVLGIDYLDPV